MIEFYQLFTWSNFFALLTLTILEIILGIDNIVFLSILVNKLPKHQQDSARIFGLMLAMLSRIALLLTITWIMKFQQPLFTVFTHTVSGRDLILILGGLFLLYKGTKEIHENLEVAKPKNKKSWLAFNGYFMIIIQIAIMDIIFSLDSVITAVGLVKEVTIMVTAIIIAIIVMILLAKKIIHLISTHPSLKMLALSFLILVGVMLVGEGMGYDISKGYIYFSMGFSFSVELLNIKFRNNKKRT